MTRISVYMPVLVAFVAAMSMILASIATPNWVSYSVTTPKGDTFDRHIGLHKSCSSIDDPPCRSFPSPALCEDGERYLCSMWRTIGFLASLAAILCLANLVTFGVIIRGGKYKRETGWPVIGAMLLLVSVVEFAVISMVAYLFENDDQFTIPGWNLDVSWYLGTASASICLLAAVALASSAYLLPPEQGYEFLGDSVNA
ncbi:pre-mRNA splicing factor [Drechmeria coniospora]|uniref:Pre-mRNA splicing factor n=1 Tax=Drechmeria coniospora TaxID=98403 RepID=A0A151GMS8_DRECN|nr:pre-mRNA splicing factor [Drechmeria coniospora]KYK58378.1 pre-mRNA splicing factor [Drechmeria coniospora]